MAEKMQEKEVNQLPDMCYTYIHTTIKIGLVKRGERGY